MYEEKDQLIHKKRILKQREYKALICAQRDPNNKMVYILRTTFLYNDRYFQIKTYCNVPGCPTFMLAETHEIENTVDVVRPNFVNVLRDVETDRFYSSHNISLRDFNMKW